MKLTRKNIGFPPLDLERAEDLAAEWATGPYNALPPGVTWPPAYTDVIRVALAQYLDAHARKTARKANTPPRGPSGRFLRSA